MIRILHAWFPKRTLVLWLSEICLVAFSFVAAAMVRVGTDRVTAVLGYNHGFLKILLMSTAVITAMHYFDLYDPSILINRRREAIRLLAVLATVYAVLGVLYRIYPAFDLGERIALIGLIFVATLLLVWRRLFVALNAIPGIADRTVVVGNSPVAALLVREFESRPELGVRIVGRTPEATDSEAISEKGNVNGGAFETNAVAVLSQTLNSLQADRIIVAMDERRGRLPVEFLFSLKCRGVQVEDGVALYERIAGKVPIEALRLSWLLFSPGFHGSRFRLACMRCGSLVVSVLGLLLSLPLLPFVVLTIKLSSEGPLLYRQKRMGRDGKVFDCYKFRTMVVDAEADCGPTWAADDDPRITRTGKFLRMSRMDEIPQLWNVLKGEMSLVGPRPERPEFVEKLSHDIPFYKLRHIVRPGITGWAQVRYKYGSSIEDAKEKLRYDLFYIKNMSAGLDLLILLNTIKIILLGRGAK